MSNLPSGDLRAGAVEMRNGWREREGGSWFWRGAFVSELCGDCAMGNETACISINCLAAVIESSYVEMKACPAYHSDMFIFSHVIVQIKCL